MSTRSAPSQHDDQESAVAATHLGQDVDVDGDGDGDGVGVGLGLGPSLFQRRVGQVFAPLYDLPSFKEGLVLSAITSVIVDTSEFSYFGAASASERCFG